MEDYVVAFIICSNNRQYYDECVRYIRDLKVPEGYDIDIVRILDAGSMARGYNEGMQSSHAKYKVYLHQDTFIINCMFIYDMLRIFQNNERIGILGVIGCAELPGDADFIMNSWDVGRIQHTPGGTDRKEWTLFQYERADYMMVEALDGMLLATQYDIAWREDILDGWDFYDISQCLEMKRYGYKVVIPFQKTAWCLHDGGVPNMQKYDDGCKKMLKEYPEFFRRREKQDGMDEHWRMDWNIFAQLKEGLIWAIEIHAYEDLEMFTRELKNIFFPDTEIYEIIQIMEIYAAERDSSHGVQSEMFELKDWETIHAYYKDIIFTLWRKDYGREDERINKLNEKLRTGKLSQEAVTILRAAFT